MRKEENFFLLLENKMATGYYKRVFDTEIQGSALISALSGNDVKALEFSAYTTGGDMVILGNTGYNLTADDLLQASIDQLIIANSTSAAAAALTSNCPLYLGTDSQSQAAAYVSFFNLTSTNQSRLLKFQLGATITSSFAVQLLTSGGSGNNVLVQWNGVTTNPTPLYYGGFSEGNSCSRTSAAGTIRYVNVFATDLVSGGQNVVFNVLPAFGGALASNY